MIPLSFDKTVFSVTVAGGFVLLLIAWYYMYSNRGNRSYRFPPSPPANTFFGHRLPTQNPFLTTETWIEQYGPLISLRVGLHRYVVIGRHKAAMDIMEKQGSNLADRPRLVASGELLARGLRIVLTPAGERLNNMRKALHIHLQPRSVRMYEPLQTSHAKTTVLGLLDSPERYKDHFRACAASVSLKLTYGKNTPTHASDPDVLQTSKSLERLIGSARPGAYLVDIFPWLKYLPWYGRELRQGFIEDHDLFSRQMNAVKQRMNDPDSGPSIGKFLLSQGTDLGLDETESAFLAGSIFSASVDTTAVTLCIISMAAARHPHAQAAVHAEMDAIIGNDRLPALDDEKSLPVLRAFILESMRWRPVATMGAPHRATKDIVWGDYYIPAGTTVFGNHWAISRDPDVFPDPDTFDWTRWLTPDGQLRDDLKYPSFGFGRRICPGQHIAISSLFINAVFVLWSFHLSVDESKPVDDLAFLQLSAHRDVPIALQFKPRMAKDKLMTMMTAT